MSFRQAIVWDLDGTLIDSAPDIAAALNALLEENGLDGHSLEQVKTMIGSGVATLIDRGFAAAGSSREPSDTEVARFMELYGARAAHATRLYDDVVETLDALSVGGYVHGLCTNKPRRLAADILARLGIKERFGFIVGGDCTPARKPAPVPLLACLEGLAVTAKQAVMVGDSAADLGAARAVGLPAVLVTFGYSQIPVNTLGADAVVDRLAQLPSVLQGLRAA